jgi:hypothetical protein
MRADFLRSTLIEESRAYGFTLAFWGSGALLIQHYGPPNLEQVIMYVGGALLGFGLLTMWAFREAFTTATAEDPEYLVLSMVHFVSAIVPILVTFMVLGIGDFAFLISGFSVATIYNILMVAEERMSRKALQLEKKFIGL